MSLPLRPAAGRVGRRFLESALRLLAPRVAADTPDAGVRRVLLSGSMGIGNAVMFEPLLHALRQRFPGAHLAVAVHEAAASLDLFRWPGLVDEVIVVHGSSRLARAVEGVRLARGRWDLCVIRFGGASRELVVATILGRIPYRVGHVTSGRFRSGLDWLFNLPVTMGDYDHEVDRDLALAERLGHLPTRRTPALSPTGVDRAAARRLIERLIGSDQRPLIGFQVGTSPLQPWKRWPTEYWRVLARGLADAGFGVIALGSAAERDLLEEVCRDTGAVNAAGLASLGVAAAVLEQCELLVCTDSALMHIAAAVGTPTVSLFGPTDRTRTRPLGAGHTVLVPRGCRGQHEPCLTPLGELSRDCTWRECMRRIEPEEVLAAVLERSRRVAC
jgi:heptosyltransferase-2